MMFRVTDHPGPMAWIFTSSAVKTKARQCLNRCGWNRVPSTRFGKPNQCRVQEPVAGSIAVAAARRLTQASLQLLFTVLVTCSQNELHRQKVSRPVLLSFVYMATSPQNLILINANIITLDPFFPRASWVAIENDKFVATGYGEDWKKLKAKSTGLIDCSGKTVIPGLIDAHLHLVSYAKSFVTPDVSPGKAVLSISDIQSIIHGRSQNRPPGKWIFARGYDEFYLAEKRHPTRWDLDEATPHHPVRLAHRSGHAHVLNSLALKLVGISKETGDPNGSMIERDLKTGEPTGLLYEMGNFLSDRIPSLVPSDLQRGLRMANKQLVSSGITSIQDASSRNNRDRWNFFKSWKESGILHPRVNMMLGYPAFIKKGYHNFSANFDKSQLRLGAIKIILDDTTGQLYPPQSELNEMVFKVHKSDRQIAIHAIEENAIEAACIAIQYALDKIPRKDHRHRIEHCSVCPPYLAKRIASLGITVVTQPPFLTYNGERYLETVPDRQLQHLYPIKTLLSYKISVAGSSDCPIAPPNPLIGIYAAISRMDETGKTVGSHEKIHLIEALQMYTRVAAHAMFEETVRGTITSGKQADLVVLSGDPTHLVPDEIKSLQVEMTLIGGEIVWERNT
jgi:predicted amidohydrolase YtcJ